MRRATAEIAIGQHHRPDLGDLASLAESIRTEGSRKRCPALAVFLDQLLHKVLSYRLREQSHRCAFRQYAPGAMLGAGALNATRPKPPQ